MISLSSRADERFFRPWSYDELNRLLASGRTMPGEVCGLLAADWWHAFLLVVLNTGAAIADVLLARPGDYARRYGTLTVGMLVYSLSPLTIEAIERICEDRDRLFPWPLDRGERRHRPRHMLIRKYRTLLYRAGLPHTTRNLFDRLRHSAQALDFGRLDMGIRFVPRDGEPKLARPLERRRRRARVLQLREAGEPLRPDPGTLFGFFEEYYRPRKYAKSPPSTVAAMKGAIARFSEYVGHPARLDELSDEALDRFAVAMLAANRSPMTVNGLIRNLTALWRYAHKKKQVETLPRDVELLRAPKRLPEAWSLGQLGRLLRACAASEGQVCGIPAGAWWTAFVLTLYETGIRVNAALQLRSSDLDWETGTLLVAAEIQKQKADQAFSLHAETLELIRQTHPERRSVLFPWRGRKRLRPQYREILRRAGLSAGSRDLFHKLRRTCATQLTNVADEKAAQKQLGHSDVGTTRGYIDPTKLTRVQETKLLPRPVWR